MEKKTNIRRIKQYSTYYIISTYIRYMIKHFFSYSNSYVNILIHRALLTIVLNLRGIILDSENFDHL